MVTMEPDFLVETEQSGEMPQEVAVPDEETVSLSTFAMVTTESFTTNMNSTLNADYECLPTLEEEKEPNQNHPSPEEARAEAACPIIQFFTPCFRVQWCSLASVVCCESEGKQTTDFHTWLVQSGSFPRSSTLYISPGYKLVSVPCGSENKH
ncbi:hypothetical protein CB1_001310007 [Camelus ferus]|nr:hypothetical protein CB1_001310007 [Camelus ferus]